MGRVLCHAPGAFALGRVTTTVSGAESTARGEGAAALGEASASHTGAAGRLPRSADRKASMCWEKSTSLFASVAPAMPRAMPAETRKKLRAVLMGPC